MCSVSTAYVKTRAHLQHGQEVPDVLPVRVVLLAKCDGRVHAVELRAYLLSLFQCTIISAFTAFTSNL